MAECYQKQNLHDNAIDSYSKAIKIKKDYALSYNNKGVSLTKLKKHNEALVEFNRAAHL